MAEYVELNTITPKAACVAMRQTTSMANTFGHKWADPIVGYDSAVGGNPNKQSLASKACAAGYKRDAIVTAIGGETVIKHYRDLLSKTNKRALANSDTLNPHMGDIGRAIRRVETTIDTLYHLNRACGVYAESLKEICKSEIAYVSPARPAYTEMLGIIRDIETFIAMLDEKVRLEDVSQENEDVSLMKIRSIDLDNLKWGDLTDKLFIPGDWGSIKGEAKKDATDAAKIIEPYLEPNEDGGYDERPFEFLRDPNVPLSDIRVAFAEMYANDEWPISVPSGPDRASQLQALIGGKLLDWYVPSDDLDKLVRESLPRLLAKQFTTIPAKAVGRGNGIPAPYKFADALIDNLRLD